MTILETARTIEEVMNLEPAKMQAEDVTELLSLMSLFAEQTEWLVKKYSPEYEPIRIETLNFFKRLVESSEKVADNIHE